MRFIAVAFDTRHLAQPVTEVEGMQLAVPVGQVALHVAGEADRGRTAVVAHVGQPVLGVIPVVVCFDPAKMPADKIIQQVVLVTELPVAAKAARCSFQMLASLVRDSPIPAT